MVQRGIPIDGVGFEFHVQAPDAHPQKSVFVANMQRYVALGLKVFVSEFDVELCTGTLADQATRFHDIVQACFGEPACAAVTVWGVTDKFLVARWQRLREPDAIALRRQLRQEARVYVVSGCAQRDVRRPSADVSTGVRTVVS